MMESDICISCFFLLVVKFSIVFTSCEIYIARYVRID